MTQDVKATDDSEAMIATALAQFNPTNAKVAEVKEYSLALKVQGPTDMEGYNACHKQLQEIRSMLGAVDKTHEDLKRAVNKYGKAVDGERRRLRSELEPVRDHLIAQKLIVDDHRAKLEAEAAARKEQERKEKLDRRMAELAKWRNDLAPSFVESLDDEAFEKCLADSEELANARRAREEEEAMEKAERAAEEAERRKAEDARLAEERKRIADEKAKLAEERRLDAERRRLEDERLRKIEQEAEERRELERAERERAQRELEEARRKFEAEKAAEEIRRADERFLKEQAERDAAAKAEAERLEKEKAEAEKAEAARRFALAPVREKLHEFAQMVRRLENLIPDVPEDMSDAIGFKLRTLAGEIEELCQ